MPVLSESNIDTRVCTKFWHIASQILTQKKILFSLKIKKEYPKVLADFCGVFFERSKEEKKEKTESVFSLPILSSS